MLSRVPRPPHALYDDAGLFVDAQHLFKVYRRIYKAVEMRTTVDIFTVIEFRRDTVMVEKHHTAPNTNESQIIIRLSISIPKFNLRSNQLCRVKAYHHPLYKSLILYPVDYRLRLPVHPSMIMLGAIPINARIRGTVNMDSRAG